VSWLLHAVDAVRSLYGYSQARFNGNLAIVLILVDHIFELLDGHGV
jgi:hypothetical protein